MRSGRVISIIVCAVLLFSLSAPTALADNVWNLPSGMLLKAVRENERYNGYSALTYLKIQDSAAAVMANRDHALLLFACKENGKTVLLECQTAVRQPGETDYKKVQLTGNHITFDSYDTQIDLGAVAKGYIADQLAEQMRSQGVTSAILNLGGNILCIGAKSSSETFTVGIQDPFDASNGTYRKLSVHDLSVVTSGIYERCFTENGITYHHLLNPVTGYPYNNGLASVTILNPSSAKADVLSTTCFALGLEQGLSLVNSISDCEAIFIATDGTISYSDGAESYLAK